MIDEKIYLYKVTSPVGKYYIGITSCYEKRMIQHNGTKASALYPVFSKYGKENVVTEVVYVAFDREEAGKAEIEFIKQYDSYHNGYNRTEGGEINFVPKKLDVDTVEDIVEDLKNSKMSGHQIAKKYGIAEPTLRSIKDGHYWARVTGGKIDRKGYTGRQHKGDNLYNSLFKDEEVKQMKLEHMNGTSVSELVKKYNSNPVTIRAVLSEQNYAHVKVPGYKYKKEEKFKNKLDRDIVYNIKLDLKEGKLKKKEIADKYNVNRNTILRIQKGITWADVKV